MNIVVRWFFDLFYFLFFQDPLDVQVQIIAEFVLGLYFSDRGKKN